MKRLLWKEAREQWLFAMATLTMPVVLTMYSRFVLRKAWELDGYGQLLALFAVIAFYGATRMPHERTRGRLTLVTLPVPAWMLWMAKVLPGLGLSLLAVWLVGLLAEPARYVSGLSSAEEAFSVVLTWTFGIAALAYAGAFLASLAFDVLPSAVVAVAVAMLAPGLMYRLFAWFAEHLAGESWTHTVAAVGFAGYAWLSAAALLLSSLVVLRSRLYVSDPRWTRWTVGVLLSGVILLPVSGLSVANAEQIAAWFGNESPDNALTPPVISRRYGRVAYAVERCEPVRGGADKDHIYRTALWTRRLDGSAPLRVDQLEVSHSHDGEATPFPDIAPVGWVSEGRLLYATRKAGAKETVWKLWTPGHGLGAPITSFVAAATMDSGDPSYNMAVEPGGTRIAVLRPAVGSLLRGELNDLWLFDIGSRAWTLLIAGPDTEGLLWRAGRIYLYGDGYLQSIAPEGGELRDDDSLPAEVVP